MRLLTLLVTAFGLTSAEVPVPIGTILSSGLVDYNEVFTAMQVRNLKSNKSNNLKNLSAGYDKRCVEFQISVCHGEAVQRD